MLGNRKKSDILETAVSVRQKTFHREKSGKRDCSQSSLYLRV